MVENDLNVSPVRNISHFDVDHSIPDTVPGSKESGIL
jgi:hypothetical protein